MQESPTSDGNGAISPVEPSSSSSSSCYEPLEPRFQVRVTQPIKDGTIVKYTLRVKQVGGSVVKSPIQVAKSYDYAM